VLKIAVGFRSTLCRSRKHCIALVGEENRRSGSPARFPAVLGRSSFPARRFDSDPMALEGPIGAQTRRCGLHDCGILSRCGLPDRRRDVLRRRSRPRLCGVRTGRCACERTTIKWAQCRALSSYVRSGGLNPSREEMIAVHVLTHESMHMSGVRSEAESECRAMQRDARMAILLGATRLDARSLASWYWKEVYPRMSPAYRSEDCGPGQALDAGLPEPPWRTSR
jgi:hypothetical protein